MSTPLQARSVPHIVTELPGPKARAHVEFDHAWTSPSLPRAYPIVPVRGEGCAIEDIDGNVFLDFAAGHRRQLDRPQPPGRRQGDPGPGREPAPHVGQRLLPADLRPGRRGARAHLAVPRPGAHVHRQQRRRGGRGRPQARPVPHAPPERDRVPRRVPRPDDGRGEPDAPARRSTTRTSARCCPASTTCRSATRAWTRSRAGSSSA